MPSPALPSFRAIVLACALLLAALPVGRARADEFPRTFESARGVALGDAYTAVADGFDAMLYNPAGLSQSQQGRVEARYWQEESRDPGVQSGNDFFDSLDGLGGKDPLVSEAFLGNNAGRPQHVRTQALAGYHTDNGFGLAWVDSVRQDTRAAESVPEQSLNVGYDRVSGALMTLSYASEVRLLMMGVTFKYLKREAAVRNVPPDVLANSAFDPTYALQGDPEYDYDLGLMTRLPFPFLRPTLGVALLNARAPDFGLEDVPPLEREFNIGLAMEPDILPDIARLLITFERRDINSKAFGDDATRRREGWGVEISAFPQDDGVHLFNVRFGNNQNEPSFGFGAHLGHYASLEYVQYKEELGQGTHQDPQIRHLIQVRLAF